MYKRASLLLIIVLLCGCTFNSSKDIPEKIKKLDRLTTYSADTRPSHNIKFNREVTFRDTARVIFGSLIRGVEVDDRGRVYIFDFRQKSIHVFTDAGEYKQSIGREGRGPGEFIMPWHIRVADSRLYILDYIQQKISVFDSHTMKHIRDFPVGLRHNSNTNPSWLDWAQKRKFRYRPNTFFVRSDGDYLIFFGDEGVSSGDNLAGRTYEMSLYDASDQQYLEHDLLSFDWTGQMLVAKVKDNIRVMADVPYKRSSQFDFAKRQLVHGWTEEFLFKFYDFQGRYQRAFYYPFEKIPLSEKAVLEHHRLSASGEAVRNDTLPDTWPAFNSVVMDDRNRLWVSTFTKDPNIYEWLVLDSSGKLMAKFRWPAYRNLQEVQDGNAYTLERNPDTGLEKVRRYRFEMSQL